MNTNRLQSSNQLSDWLPVSFPVRVSVCETRRGSWCCLVFKESRRDDGVGWRLRGGQTVGSLSCWFSGSIRAAGLWLAACGNQKEFEIYNRRKLTHETRRAWPFPDAYCYETLYFTPRKKLKSVWRCIEIVLCCFILTCK